MKPNIYVVDDDAGIRDSLGRLLLRLKFAVETFESAAKFLRAIGEKASGCAIVDLKMPDMSGLELLREMNARRFAIRAIMLTGHGDDSAQDEAMAAGASDFLTKPFMLNRLLEAIEKAASPKTQVR